MMAEESINSLQTLATSGLDESQKRRVYAGLGGNRETGKRRLAAFIVAKTGRIVTESDLRQQLTELLSPSMIPSLLAVVPNIPRTPNGKVDFTQLSKEAAGNIGSESPLAAEARPKTTDTLRDKIENSWRVAIGLDSEARVEHFFRAGGNSLAGMRCVSLLSRELGVDIPLVELFRRPVIDDFTESIRDLLSQAGMAGDC